MVDENSLLPQRDVTIAQHVISREIDYEMVLVNLETERMFTLNDTGAQFWRLLMEGKKLDQIKQGLQVVYAVDGLELEKEIDDLLQTLLDEGLVTCG